MALVNCAVDLSAVSKKAVSNEKEFLFRTDRR